MKYKGEFIHLKKGTLCRILQHPCDCFYSLFDKQQPSTPPLFSPQKRYGDHHVAQSPSPNTRQPSSCGTALGPPIFPPQSGPPQSGATPGRPARTTRPSLSYLTATTTCTRTCTLCRCPPPPPTAVAPRPERPRALAAPEPPTRARPGSSSSCPAPS